MSFTLPSPPTATAAATPISYPPSPSWTLQGGITSPSSVASASHLQRPLRPPVLRQKSKPKFSLPTFDSESPETPPLPHQEKSSAPGPSSALLSTPLPPPLRPEFATFSVQASIPFPSATPSLDDKNSSTEQVRLRSDIAVLSERLSSTEPLLSPRLLLKPSVSIHRGANLRIDLEGITGGGPLDQDDSLHPYSAPDSIPVPPIPSVPKHSRTQFNQRTSYVRKKSGELVKPSLKPLSASMFVTPSAAGSGSGSSQRRENLRLNLDGLPLGGSHSEPTTPNSPKAVHFDSNLERVKHFLAEQTPLAVSRDGSPTETSEGGEDFLNYSNRSSEEEKVRQALEIQMVNAPPKSALEHLAEACNTDHVRLERLFLSDDGRCVRGLVIVRNLAFAKWVAARFTMDRWQTTSEVTARYVTSVRDGAYDRFEFSIRLIDYLGKIWEKTLHIAIRYTCEGHPEMWDSNGGQNYIVVFRRKSIKRTPVVQDTDDDDDDDDGILVKMAALKRKLETAMHSPSPRAVLHARANSVQNLVTPPTSTPPFVNNRSAADVLLRVGKQNSPITSGASSPTRRTFFQGDASVVSPRKNREGTLAGRYDLESSLKNASSIPAMPHFPQGGMIRSPTAMTSVPRTPDVSERSQKFPSTPVSFPARSTGRGSPRDIPGTPYRDASPHSPPFRTSSDSDIPASFHSIIASSSAPYDGFSSPPTPGTSYRLNVQRSLFVAEGTSPVSRDGSPQRADRTPVSPPLLTENMAVDSRSSPTGPTGAREALDFNSFPTSMNSTNSNTSLSTAFPWGTSLTSVSLSSVEPPLGSESEGIKDSQAALPEPNLNSAITGENLNSDSSAASTPSGTSESSEQSSSAPDAAAGLPLNEMLNGLSMDVNVGASVHNTGASVSRENRDSVEPATLRSFLLDQFCFFTGLDAGLASRRSHSASDVSDFFQRRQQSEPSVVSDTTSGRTTPTVLTTQHIT